MTDGRPMWRVIGPIAGPKLPDAPGRFGRVNIGPLPAGKTPLNAGELTQAGSSKTRYVFGRGRRIDIESDRFFWVDVAATSADAAMNQVKEQDLAPLLVCLSLRQSGEPYQAKIWSAMNVITQQSTAYSNVTRFYAWSVGEMSSAEMGLAKHDLQSLVSDGKARRAAEYFQDAVNMESCAMDNIGKAIALLTYFKVIELLSTSIAPHSGNDQEVKEEKIIQRLVGELTSKAASRKKKVKAVHSAHDQFRRLAGDFLSLRIEAAGERLGLSADWKERARRFSKLRNEKLGHATLESGFTEIHVDFSPRDLSREMLRAYVDLLQLPEGKEQDVL